MIKSLNSKGHAFALYKIFQKIQTITIFLATINFIEIKDLEKTKEMKKKIVSAEPMRKIYIFYLNFSCWGTRLDIKPNISNTPMVSFNPLVSPGLKMPFGTRIMRLRQLV